MQKSERPLDNEDIYMRPESIRSQKVGRNEFYSLKQLPSATISNKNLNECNVCKQDFMYWKEEKFENLPNDSIRNIWEALLKQNDSIKWRPGLRISTALAQY